MALEPRSSATITQALRGIEFPCTRQGLIEHARRHEADREVIELLERLPGAQYTSMADIFMGLGMAEEPSTAMPREEPAPAPIRPEPHPQPHPQPVRQAQPRTPPERRGGDWMVRLRGWFSRVVGRR